MSPASAQGPWAALALLALSSGFACGDSTARGSSRLTPNLNGAWNGSCTNENDDAQSVEERAVFRALNVEVTESVYEGPDCRTLERTQIISGQFSLTVPQTGSSSAFSIDVSLNSLRVTLSSTSAVARARQEESYGMGDWEADVEQEVLPGLQALGQDRVFGLVKVDEDDPELLLLSPLVLDESARPTELTRRALRREN